MLRGPRRESRGKVSVSPKWSVPSLLGLTLPKPQGAALPCCHLLFPTFLPWHSPELWFASPPHATPLCSVPLLIPPPSWLSAVMGMPALPLSRRTLLSSCHTKREKGLLGSGQMYGTNRALLISPAAGQWNLSPGYRHTWLSYH